MCVIALFDFNIESAAQNEDKALLFQTFLKQFTAGDLINAELTLQIFLESKDNLTEEQKSAAYNNLGAINILLGKYDIALEYNEKAEFFANKIQNNTALADIYNNRARIYTLNKSFNSAIDYLEKGIRLYTSYLKPDQDIIMNLSSAYLNIGIAYYNLREFSTAELYLEKSLKLKIIYKLPEIAHVYLNQAKTFSKSNKKRLAEIFYIKSISSFESDFGKEYYRIADVYFDYGLYLRSEGKILEAREAHERALSICLKNYGEKHTLTSLSYKHLADDYLKLNKLDSSLYFYQKSLMSVGKDFSNPDIFTNPSIDSSLFDIRLLDNLKSKAQALDLYAGEQQDPVMKLKVMKASLATIGLALQLIDRIRNDYMSEESRIYLAENEKETYIFATHLAYSLYSTTHDESTGIRMYSIAQKAKAAILRNEISGNELLYSAGVPDSLREKQKRLTGNIAAYNNMILEEYRKVKPDSSRISLWKDALFDMNREKEKVTANIEKAFPQFHDLIRKTEPLSLQFIRKQLKKDETIVDYLVSNQYTEGKRRLYIFLISHDSLDIHEEWLDSLFVKNAELIRKTANPSNSEASQEADFNSYTGALHYMYMNLIKPVESRFRGKKLFIIPDEEIGWLPFDAFLKEMPHRDQHDYEGLSYLISDYTFSYGYSSSLIFSQKPGMNRRSKVLAFSPDYSKETDSKETNTGPSISALQGTGPEIQSIFKNFRGKSFIAGNATKANFLKSLQIPSILHLAMHSMTDTLNSKYSYLMFDTHNVPVEQGKLFNYEISLTRIKSPMVVLSACNSGAGTLFYGEGTMSLARSFRLAGASSVIVTDWEINDEVSAGIMSRFYYCLSEGMEKDEAMRQAKLEYLKSVSPAFKNPYYWAAYEVVGSNAPVASNTIKYLIYISCGVMFAAIMMILYFNRRRIFSDRSR